MEKTFFTWKNILVAALFLFGTSFSLFSQDFHLSQYDANPLYLNPALTGLRMVDKWDYRINTNYRTQWNKFPGSPYSTLAAGFDLPVSKRFSIGEFVINNASAGGQINTFNLMTSFAYNISKIRGEEDLQNLSVGLQIGFLQKSLNPSTLVFDSQYSASEPDAFDEDLPSGENFNQVNLLNLDANFGVFYSFSSASRRFSPFMGFSIYHLTQPNESFAGIASRTPMRFTIHGGSWYALGEKITIQPLWLYMYQAKATELNLGMLGYYKIQDSAFEPIVGFSYRNDDAIVVHIGLKHAIGMFRISYDVNTSRINSYTKAQGGPEFSFIYTGKKANKTEPSSVPDVKTNKADL